MISHEIAHFQSRRVEVGLPKDTQPQKEQIKVTDRRIFTADGEIREEFRDEIRPADASSQARTPEPAAEPIQDATTGTDTARKEHDERRTGGDRRRTVAGSAENPNTAFSEFIEGLIAQAYMFLGMLPHPNQPAGKLEPAAARQMIDILTLLKEKTAGNLTADEDAFLSTHLGQLKLAFVQRTKTI
ncbi:MAG: DUF1844 domain-containing protein [Acidobacteriota bacterium]